jgi:transposase-like protein
MQILHPFTGSVQQYLQQLDDPDQHRPTLCPQCQAKRPLTAHGFYTRTILDIAFDGSIRVRRYLCQACRRTVSLLPDFALPYLRSSLTVIALFLIARLLQARSLAAALPPSSPYQRGQFWLRRFRAHAEALCAALAALTTPDPAPDFVHRALSMLQSPGWIPAHRFLFAGVREHLLGWPRSLLPDGRRPALVPAAALL